MMRSISAISVATTVLFALTLSGCATEVNEAAGADVEIQALEIASVSTAGAKITFLQLDSPTDIAIEETASSYAVETPMDQLATQELTSLEIFLAVAPDEPPPEALVQAHSIEAKARGRDSDAIRKVTLDRSRISEKSVSPTQCSEFLKTPYNANYQGWVNQDIRFNNITYAQGLCGGLTCDHGYAMPQNVIVMAACNNSTNNLALQFKYRNDNVVSWNVINRTALPDQISKYYGTRTVMSNYAMQATPANSSSPYHLRAALAYHK